MPSLFLHKLIHKVIPDRLRCYARERAAFVGKSGIEFGGPSPVFGAHGIFPVYPVAARIDNCNFEHQTLWEGQINPQSGFHFAPRREPGQQFVAEATELRFLAEESYDFVLSSHMLEHSANPIRALTEWLRILRPGGTLLLILPHREGTFDHRRPVTPLEHLVEDFDCQMGEDDLTHLPEILRLHDLRRDPEAGGAAAFKARSELNRANRGLHHHVFDTRSAVELLNHMGVRIRAVEAAFPFHIATLATRPESGQRADNALFLGALAPYRTSSPFRSDRRR
jgi:SAM-dependent methyltransferase